MVVHEDEVAKAALVSASDANPISHPAVLIRLVIAMKIVRRAPTFATVQHEEPLIRRHIQLRIVVKTESVNFALSVAAEVKLDDRIRADFVVEFDHLRGVADHVKRRTVVFDRRLVLLVFVPCSL